MPGAFTGEIGITEISTGLIESVEITKSADSKTILNADGTFAKSHVWDPKMEFTVKGRGSVTGTAGTSNLSSFIPDSVEGFYVITSIKKTEKNDDFNEFEVSGIAYEDATALP